MFCVYLLASKPYGTLYIGVASDLVAQIIRLVPGSWGGSRPEAAIDCNAVFAFVTHARLACVAPLV